MKKTILGLLLCGLPLIASAQAAFDALQMSQTELRGTSRSMAMAGAFGALGGDLSTLNQNPGGIGVYRSSDLGITLSLDMNSSKTDGSNADNETKFMVNNVGYVGVLKLDSEVMPNLNFGFSYNRDHSYHRHYRGGMNNIQSSISNYMAAVTTSGNWTTEDLAITDNYNPYYDSSAPWMSVLGYDSYVINPLTSNNDFQGLYGDGTHGFAEMEVDESGRTDEYNINFGGNISNTVYWGVGFGITDLKYDSYQYYGESLTNAYVNDGEDYIVLGDADYGFVNYLSSRGNGYNFKMGVIVKPVNEFRIGLAFHTPTYYDMKDLYKTISSYGMSGEGFNYSGGHESGDEGYWDEYRYRIQTPWRFIGSLAGVIGTSGIISADYEWVGANTMRIKDDGGYEFVDATNQIKDYMQAQHIVRIGGEYRVNPNWSLRAGYSYVTSPVNSDIKDNLLSVVTSSNNPAYQYDKSTQYFTCGFGYHYKSFYFDMAYVHKYRQSEFHAFAPVSYTGGRDNGNWWNVEDHNNRVSMTLGFRF